MFSNNSAIRGNHRLRFEPLAVEVRSAFPAPSRVIAGVLVAAVAVWIGAGVAQAADPQPVGGPSGNQWVLVPAFSDDFNGSALDATKWAPNACTSDLISIAGGTLNLTLTQSGDFNAGRIRSNDLNRYGYYEARIKPANVQMNNAFWLYTRPQGPEIDIVEQYGSSYPNMAMLAAHYWDANGQHQQYTTEYYAQEDLTADYHVYGVDWNPNTITWYVDGVQRKNIANVGWAEPLPIIVGMVGGAIPELWATMSVDYVRTWQPASTVLWADNLETQPLDAVLTTLTPPVGTSYTGNAVGVVANASTAPAPGATNPGKFATAPAATNAFVELHNVGEAETAGKVVKTKMDIYVASDGDNWANTAFALDSGNKTVFQLNLRADNGEIWSYNPGWGAFLAGSYTRDSWIPVEVVADYAAQTYTASVGGVTWSGSFVDAGITSQSHLYLAPSSSSSGAYFDNVFVQIVPEPSALLLMATGLLGLLAYAWRKQRIMGGGFAGSRSLRC